MLSSSGTSTIGGVSRMMLPLRLRRVAGHEGRLNDALFQPAARAPPLGSQTIVYFGGDVQVHKCGVVDSLETFLSTICYTDL